MTFVLYTFLKNQALTACIASIFIRAVSNVTLYPNPGSNLGMPKLNF